MEWRDTFLRWFGPGMLAGITFGDRVRLLCDNRFKIPPNSRLHQLTARERRDRKGFSQNV